MNSEFLFVLFQTRRSGWCLKLIYFQKSNHKHFIKIEHIFTPLNYSLWLSICEEKKKIQKEKENNFLFHGISGILNYKNGNSRRKIYFPVLILNTNNKATILPTFFTFSVVEVPLHLKIYNTYFVVCAYIYVTFMWRYSKYLFNHYFLYYQMVDVVTLNKDSPFLRK